MLTGKMVVESAVTSDMMTSEKQLKLLDELATERLLHAGGQDLAVKRKVLAGESGVRDIR